MAMVEDRVIPLDVTGKEITKPIVGSGIVDADIHPLPVEGALNPYLDERWQNHMKEYGARGTTGLEFITEYPQMYGGAMRADSWPDDGGFPGSSLQMLQEQLLDPCNISLGVMQVLAPGGQTLNPASQALNQELAAALCAATNDWQMEEMVMKEPRLRSALTVTFETPEFAIEEIDRWKGNPGVVSVLGGSKTIEPMGSRKYWPLYQASVDAGLPVMIHLSQGGGHANTGTGWTSYHPEYHAGHTQSFTSQVASLLLSGVFDAIPDFKIMFVEGNILHMAALAERMDYHWDTLHREVPHLTRKPSEYIKDHIFAATQPVDEPEKPEHLAEMLEEFGGDNVVFSTDYPHFDYDDPSTVFPRSFPEELKNKIFRDNGIRFFGLEG